MAAILSSQVKLNCPALKASRSLSLQRVRVKRAPNSKPFECSRWRVDFRLSRKPTSYWIRVRNLNELRNLIAPRGDDKSFICLSFSEFVWFCVWFVWGGKEKATTITTRASTTATATAKPTTIMLMKRLELATTVLLQLTDALALDQFNCSCLRNCASYSQDNWNGST